MSSHEVGNGRISRTSQRVFLMSGPSNMAQSVANSMDANMQLHATCSAFHSNLLSACRLVMVTSLINPTAHLSGKCALHTALKVLITTNYTNIFDGNDYLAIYSMTKFINDCRTG
jgi:hypothetical protein